MITSAKVEKPGEVTLSVTITMTVSEWRALRQQMNLKDYPGFTLASAIDNVTRKVESSVLGCVDSNADDSPW